GKGEVPATYAIPPLEPILERTLGVPLFQEQLLRMAMAVAGFSGGEAEELRRAMGFKRSEARMRAIEQRLRDGMARNGITGATADAIVLSITSFALYGFPESHAASFALLVYASAYLKAHYPAAFFAALLNNQPLGFYHPATLIKDAQRHGVRFTPVDVQVSKWKCVSEDAGAVRLGFCMVQGLREEVGRRMEKVGTALRAVRHDQHADGGAVRHDDPPASCPKRGGDDPSMIEVEAAAGTWEAYCNVCAHDWRGGVSAAASASTASNAPAVAAASAASAATAASAAEVRMSSDSARPRFRSVDDLVAQTG